MNNFQTPPKEGLKRLIPNLTASSSPRSPLLMKLLLLSTSAISFILLVYLFLKKKKEIEQKKQQKALVLREQSEKFKVLLKELEIEASLSVSIAHIKYRDKNLMNKETKKQQLINEYKESIVSYYLSKFSLSKEEMETILKEDSALKGRYDSFLAPFESFKERKPEQLDIYISKFNSKSMKIIYKKYLAYLRYLVYHATKDHRDYHERFSLHLAILADESHLRSVFNLYVMSFDDKN
jgi:hypothetical protein